MLIDCTRKPSRLACWRRRAVVLAAIGAIASVGACAPRMEQWSPAEAPKEPRVRWATFHHDVAFAPGSAALANLQQQEVTAFVDRVGSGEGVRVLIAAHPDTSSALALRREATLAELLRARGYSVSLGRQEGSRAVPGAVHVTVGRHVIRTPRCPDWSKPATGDAANRVSSNFGCADSTNFALMLADPGVLVRPAPTGPMDGEVAAAGIDVYRKGDAEEAPSITPLVIQSGSGN